jgi:hypothetical protein
VCVQQNPIDEITLAMIIVLRAASEIYGTEPSASKKQFETFR